MVSPLSKLLLLVALGAPLVVLPAALAKRPDEREEEEIDLLSLSARLVADEHYDRALTVMKEIDPNDEKVDKPKLHFLFGTIYLKKELYAEARDAYKRSVAAGQQNLSIFVYLAQAHFELGEFREAISALDKAKSAADQSPGSFLMRAEAYWKLKERKNAVRTLDRGIARFPRFHKLTLVKLGYLIDLGLYQEVVRVGEGYLKRPDATAEDFVTFAEGLRRSKQLPEARQALEQARLRYPDELNVTLQLANTYNDLGKPLAAAMLYEEASQRDTKYSFEAAELYKQAGRPARALALNARTLDAQRKLKQRLAILLDMERFEMIAAMEPSLSRAGLLKDDSIRYALAYGHFKNGEFSAAERHLKLLQDASSFDRATALRKAMATCKEAGWACH